MADENTGTLPEPETVAEIDIEAVDALSPEDSGKLLRGETEPPRKGVKVETSDKPKDEFDVDPKSETVPFKQFDRVRHRAKEFETERQAALTRAEQAEARANTAMQRLTEIMAASKPAEQPKEEPPPPPTLDGDPLAFVEYTAKEVQELKAQIAQQKQATQEERAAQEWIQKSAADLQDYGKAVPEGSQAADWLWGWGLHQIQQKSPGLHEAAVQQNMNDWQVKIAQQAHQMGIRPARLMHMMALDRGFQPEPAKAVPPKDPDTGRFTKAAAEMDKREATKAAAKSLGGSGGPADGGEVTAEMIVGFNEAEYAAWKKANGGEQALRKFFGAKQ